MNGESIKVSVTHAERAYTVPGAVRICLNTPEGDEDLLVTQLEPNLYQLEESTLLNELELRWHDVIQASEDKHGVLRYVGLVSRSGLRTVDSIVSKTIQDSDGFKNLLAKIMSMGGNWELALGGLLLLHVPASQESSIAEELTTLMRNR